MPIAKCRAVPEIRANFIPASTVKCNAQIRCGPEDQGWSRAPDVYPKKSQSKVFLVNDPFSKKNQNSVPKKFVTSIHVLCPNFKEIRRRKADETLGCFADKKVKKCGFSPLFCARLAVGAKSL